MIPTRFQVDLGGLISLLSEHLYSGPQVFVRELLQNAVDAITARRELDPDAESTVRLRVDERDGVPALVLTDSGVGLTSDQAVELLATIGASSKRDVLGGRRDFIGQFGVGMLSAFLVSDTIEITSRSAVPGAEPIRWVGHARGEFEVQPGPADAPIGTSVLLRAKPGAEHWYDTATLVALARDFGSLLPVDVSVLVPVEGSDPQWLRISARPAWEASYSDAASRRVALARYCEDAFGFTPLAQIDLSLPVAGLTGVAFVLPRAVAPSPGHARVYVKGMLVGSRVEHVLPEWAFFVRAVVTSTALTPSASREQLHHDEITLAVQEGLGRQIKDWVAATLTRDDRLAREFIDTHHLALRALALNDDTMLDLVASVLPFETTEGRRTLRELREEGPLLYASTLEDYRRVATVARAQGLTIVNAGYVYDADLISRLQQRRGWSLRETSSADLTQILGLLPPERERAVADMLERARNQLEWADCDVIVRSFEPDAVPAVLLRDAAGERRRDLARERAAEPDRWDGLLGVLGSADVGRSRTLVLNDRAAPVQSLLGTGRPEVFEASLNCLYLSAVMLAGEGLASREMHTLNGALTVLMEAALVGREE